MLFYHIILNLAKFLFKEASKLSENEFDPIIMENINAWNHSDFMCKNYSLDELDNTVYNIYSSIKSTKVLWKALDKKNIRSR
jgi:hypothetical protein